MQAIVVEPVNGVYSYSMTVPGIEKLVILAGSDTDNDGAICNRGEACGAYPLLGDGQTEILQPRGDLSGMDFSLVPFGGINAESASIRLEAGGKSMLTDLLPALGTTGFGIRRPERVTP